MPTDPTRADAEALLFEFTQSDALRMHGRAVEVAMRAYAGWFGVREPAEIEDKAFARSVDRSYAYGGAEAIGRPLADHVGFLIEALIPAANEIGL